MKKRLVDFKRFYTKKDFPGITLEKNEHVKLKVRRSRVIPIAIWTGMIIATILFTTLNMVILTGPNSAFMNLDSTSRGFLGIIISVVFGVVLIAALISVHVYSNNRLLVTDKRIVQQVQSSLFSSSTNVIDLVSIEDVSFKQEGIFEHLLQIGTLKMSTVGDETTYTFKFVDTPIDELETITHLVHVIKEGKS